MAVLARHLLEENASNTSNVRRLLVLSSKLDPGYPDFRDMKNSPYYRCHVFECSGRGIAGIHPLPADELLGFTQQERAELLSDVEAIEKNWDWSEPHKKSCFTETRITLYKLAKDDSTIERPTKENTKDHSGGETELSGFYTDQDSLNNEVEEDLDTKYAQQSAKSNNPAPHNNTTSPSSYDFIEDAYIENLKQAAELYKASADSIEKKLGFVHTLWQEPGTPNSEPHNTLDNSQEAPTGSVIPGLFKLVFPYLSKRNPGPSDTSRPPTPPLEGDEVAFDDARKHFLKYDPARVPLLAVQWKFTQASIPLDTEDTENFFEMNGEEVLDNTLIVLNDNERSIPYLGNTSRSDRDEQSTPELSSTSKSGDISISHQGGVSSERSISDVVPSTSYELSRSLGSKTGRLSPIVEKDDPISPNENVSIESLGLGRLFNDKDMSNGDSVQNESHVEFGSTTPPECDAPETQGVTLDTAGPINLADVHCSFPKPSESIEELGVPSIDIFYGSSIDIFSETDRKKFVAEATRQINIIDATMSRIEKFYPGLKDRSEIADDKHSSFSSEKRDANRPSLELENTGLAIPEGVFRSNATNTNPEIDINKPNQANENPSEDTDRTETDLQDQNKSNDAIGTLQIRSLSATEYIIMDSTGSTVLGSGMVDSATLSLFDKDSTQLIKIVLKPEPPSCLAKGISTLITIRSSLVHLLNLYIFLSAGYPSLRIPVDWYFIAFTTLEAAKYWLFLIESEFGSRSAERFCPEFSIFLHIDPFFRIVGLVFFMILALTPTAPIPPNSLHTTQCTNCMNIPPSLVFTYNNAICPANYSASPYVPVAQVFGLNTTTWLPTATCEAVYEDRVETTPLDLAVKEFLAERIRWMNEREKRLNQQKRWIREQERREDRYYGVMLANEVFQMLRMILW